MSEFRTVVEGDVTILVKKPTRKELNDSQIVYNKVWRESLEKKAILRQKLNDYLIEQGVWSDEKQRQYEDFIKKINERELLIKKGGIPLKKAKSIALELKRLRIEFRDLIAERTAYDTNTAEGTADNSRFDYLVSVCTLDPSSKKPVFKDIDDYNERGTEPWAIKAASELANYLYNLDPSYEKNLPENNFLSKFNFTDSQGRFVNKEGHLISIDENGVERLIDEEGYFIAYEESGEKHYVNRDGERVERDQDVVSTPFLDDDGNPISESTETPVESAAEETKKTKKKKSDSTE
jgi:hypothetical protein